MSAHRGAQSSGKQVLRLELVLKVLKEDKEPLLCQWTVVVVFTAWIVLIIAIQLMCTRADFAAYC